MMPRDAQLDSRTFFTKSPRTGPQPNAAVCVESRSFHIHATLRIGDSMVMIAQATEPAHAMPASLYLYLPNVDATYQLAIKAGATSVMEPADQFYGDRCGGVKDSAGNQWFLATHIEDVQVGELKRRAAEFFRKQGNAA
jgi:uncharacterized glyoxalase superfamily protein PhnB